MGFSGGKFANVNFEPWPDILIRKIQLLNMGARRFVP